MRPTIVKIEFEGSYFHDGEIFVHELGFYPLFKHTCYMVMASQLEDMMFGC